MSNDWAISVCIEACMGIGALIGIIKLGIGYITLDGRMIQALLVYSINYDIALNANSF